MSNLPEVVEPRNLPVYEDLRRQTDVLNHQLDDLKQEQSRHVAEIEITRQSSTFLNDQVTRLRRTRRRYRWLIALVALILIVIIVTIGVFFAKKNHDKTSTASTNLVTKPTTYTEVPPITNSPIGAAVITQGETPSSSSSSTPKTVIAYHGGNGMLCVHEKWDTGFHNNMRCAEIPDLLPESPVTVLDWMGGYSIYYFTKSYLVAGIDHIPEDDTWKYSSVNKYNIRVHEQSQLASVTWLNGSSTWIYYQDPVDSQIHEFGLDDYRGSNWRNGSLTSKAKIGTGIAVVRWLSGSEEIEEIIFQLSDGALGGRMFKDSNWINDPYAINQTFGNVPDTTSISATVVSDSNANGTMILSYFAQSGFLNVQTRAIGNAAMSKPGDFSARTEVVEGDGEPRAGLAAVGGPGSGRIYFGDNDKILEATRGNGSNGTWSTIVT